MALAAEQGGRDVLADVVERLASRHARDGKEHLRFSVGELLLYIGPSRRGDGTPWILRDICALGRTLEDGVASGLVLAARTGAHALTAELARRDISPAEAVAQLSLVAGVACWRRGGAVLRHPPRRNPGWDAASRV